MEDGHDAIHIGAIGLATAEAHAERDPVRLAGQRRAWSRVALIVANLRHVTADLEAGALVVVEAGRVRSRRLPLLPD